MTPFLDPNAAEFIVIPALGTRGKIATQLNQNLKK
jgi:hypothetical protein